MAKIDITGQTFGRLTVIKENGKDNNNKIFWLCRCECGTEKNIRGSDLRSGKILSCGCLNKERTKEASKKRSEEKKNNPSFYNDLTGQIFGKLTVLEFDREGTIQKREQLNNKFSYWKCQCDCGNIVTVCSTNLTNGKTKSCGCLVKEVSAESMKKIQPLGAQSALKDLTGQYFNEILVVKRYEQNTSCNKVQWVCQCHCGNTFITTGDSLKKGYVKSCGCIGRSIGEHKIHRILLENNIPFRKEVKFEDLKDKTYLRFDFAILDNNNSIIKLIEFDGRQHSDKTSIWYTDKTVMHDQIKNNYCQTHNIPLLRISYTDIDKITLDYLLNQITL